MIKVGITGCDHLLAAELVRLLINHPDVQLEWVTASCLPGTRLDQLVPGIIGECDLVVKDPWDCEDVDIVFLGAGLDPLPEALKKRFLSQDCRIVDLTGGHNLDHGEGKPWTYGMSEMQRRVLVHDARQVTLPGAVAMAALLALLPMARNNLLNSPITVLAAASSCFLDSMTAGTLGVEQIAQQQTEEVLYALAQCQSGFDHPVSVDIISVSMPRVLGATVSFKSELDEGVVRQLYEQYYDDHNFVFLVDRSLVSVDVANTNKCLIHIVKKDGCFTLNAMIDGFLKGGAGTAVHAMNLMFGLHERVGLTLKGTGC